MSKTGHMLYQHYGPAFSPTGIDMVGIEVGENINSVQARIAFARGAARQYDKTWAVDFSLWFARYVPDSGGYWLTIEDSAVRCNDTNYQLKPDVQLIGDRLAYLDTEGNLKYKDGSSAKVTIGTGVTTFRMAATYGSTLRLAYMNASQIWFNTTGTSSGSTSLSGVGAGDIDAIAAVSGTRIALLKKNADMLVAPDASGNNGTLYQYTGPFAKAWLLGDTVFAQKANGDVYYATGSGTALAQSLTKLVSAADIVALESETSILYSKDGEIYRRANFSLPNSYDTEFSQKATDKQAGVGDIRIEGARYGVLYKNGRLLINTGLDFDITDWTLAHSDAKAFRLSGERLAVLENSMAIGVVGQGDPGNALMMKDGALTTAWSPVLTVDLDDFDISKDGTNKAIFAKTKRDKKILFKLRGIEQLEFTELTDLQKYNVWIGNEPDSDPDDRNSRLRGGHSPSLMERVFYASYMMGANVYVQEGGNVAFFLGRYNSDVAKGLPLTLSLHGSVALRGYQFTMNTFPEHRRGISWNPVALMLHHVHGIGLQTFKRNLIFHWRFSENAMDAMNFTLLKAVWPDTFWGSIASDKNESTTKFLINTPYGDIYDVLTDDVLTNTAASSGLIDNYPVLFLSGAIRPDASERTKLMEYVSGGGNLVLNSEMNVGSFPGTFTGVALGAAANVSVGGLRWKLDNSTKTFTAAETYSSRPMTLSNGAAVLVESTGATPRTLASIKSHGKGRVVVVGVPNMRYSSYLGFLLGKLSNNAAVSPFRVSGDALFSFSYRGLDTWIVLLINNDGIGKPREGLQTVDSTESESVTLTLQEPGRNISSITEVAVDNGPARSAPSFRNNAFSTTLSAGEIRIFEVRTAASS